MVIEHSIHLPLFGFFEKLQASGLPLGLEEYKLLLIALSDEHTAPTNSADLLLLCEHLWFKPGESEKLFQDWFWEALKKEQEEALKRLTKEESTLVAETARVETQTTRGQGTRAVDGDAHRVTPEAEQAPVEQKEKRRDEEEEEEEEDDFTQDSFKGEAGSIAVTNEEDFIYINIHAQGGSGSAIAVSDELALPEERSFTFEGGFNPMSQRELKNSWRYLPSKQVARTYSQDIDVKATVKKLASNGESLWSEPVFKQQCEREAQLFILTDHLGSMVAFEELSQDISRAAHEWFGERFGARGIENYFFQNTPKEYLYRNTSHTKYHTMAQLHAKHAMQSVPVLIISDAGAARGEFNPERVQTTRKALEAIRGFASHIAWLNPMPAARWKDTTAEAINNMLPGGMCEATNAGFMRAINILRGKILK